VVDRNACIGEAGKDSDRGARRECDYKKGEIGMKRMVLFLIVSVCFMLFSGVEAQERKDHSINFQSVELFVGRHQVQLG